MDRRPPSGSSNCKSCPNEPLGMLNPTNFHHAQFPHHVSFSQPSYSMNFPHHQYPQQHQYPPHVQYIVVQPQYGPFSLPQSQTPPSGAVLAPASPPPPARVISLPAAPLPPAGVSVSESGTPHSVTGPDEQNIVNVGNDRNAEPDRTSRRLSWTEVEDLRLVSAWLNSSKPRNSKKHYWANVAGVYNRNTPKDRRRARLQLKNHWQRINKRIAHFYDCWCRVEAKYSSVQSEKMQLMDKTWAMYNEQAREMYLEEAKHHFTFSHCWKAVWDRPKWKRHISSLYSKKTEFSESDNCTSSSEDAEDAPETETGEQSSMPVTVKKKQEVTGNLSSPLSALQDSIQDSVDPQNVIEKNHKEMTKAELQSSDQKLEPTKCYQLEMKDKEMVILAPPPPPPAGVIPLPAPPLPPPAGVVPLLVSESGIPHSITGPGELDIFSVGNDTNAEPHRTSRRLSWTEVEELRLVDAWLNSSKLRNAKKHYWAHVTGVYNSNTPKDRRRARFQLKNHWQRINQRIAHFYDCWCRVEAKYSYVQCEKMQLMDKTWAMYNEEAREMYLEEAKHHFAFSHCWKAVWDQPKWKRHISSLYSKKTELSESVNCTSSSEDAPEIEAGEQGSIPVKKKHGVIGKVSPPSSELQDVIQDSVDPRNVIEKNHKEMTKAELQRSEQKLEPTRSYQLEMKDKEIVISEMQTDPLMADTSRIHEFQNGRDGMMVDIAKFNEFQHKSVVRGDVPEKRTHPQGHKTVEHAGTVRGGLPEAETYQQDSKMAKSKRKRKGNASTPLSEVQEDIKRAVDLQTMLQKDREKMSEVQLRLSKEKLELARLKQQEAKDRKETTLYEKYTELLMANTQRFDEFQKEEHRKAVKCMGEMLFGNGSKQPASGNLKRM